ncbi:MAG: PAS domain S-box protein [Myxococcales bacterium]|nr:PAS domain S-box protein [Myxococcales bacterium]
MTKRPGRGQGYKGEGAGDDAREFESEATTRTRRQTLARFPLLPPADVLKNVLEFSRAVTVDLGDGDLYRILFDGLRALLPGRLVAVRVLDPKTHAATQVLADAPLVDDVLEMLATVQRGALDHQNVRDNLPRDPQGRGELALPDFIRLVDEHPLIFRDAVAGFTVPLLAGGQMMGEVHVNYPEIVEGSGAQGWFPVKPDQGLVIPIANHIAVVGHTRRLLRETSYLQEYLEQLVDQANALIVATDLEGKVTVWNRALHRLTGFSRWEAIGKDLGSWWKELGTPQLPLVMRQAAASGDTVTREMQLPSAGGAVIRAAFNVVTVKTGEMPAAILAVGQDVTAFRALQGQVIHAEKLATLGQIAAGVAHEINNPLTSIQVCADAVGRKAKLALEGRVPNAFEPADIDRLKKITEGAERIRRFAKDLVTYARPSGTENEPFDLNDLVAHGLSFCEHVLDEANATVERDLHPDLPPLTAIRDQILQVVINLITNAAQALPTEGGQVRVRTWRRGNAAVGVAISDTGRGIREADRPHVFEPFFTTKPAGRGTGLGLSIVRNIVFSHGGQITFQSRQGGGTTFVVTLPLAREVPTPPDADASDAVEPQKNVRGPRPSRHRESKPE